MMLTRTDELMPGANAHLTGATGTCPGRLVRAVRAQVRRRLDWAQTSGCVAGALQGQLPDPAFILPAALRRGDPSGYQSHLIYAEPDGSFSIAAMVWLPGQQTVIHDHVAWCVTAVLQGREYEEIFALADGGRTLDLVASNVNLTGSVSGFAPPGDIHRVRNTGDDVAISMHVYGADISRLGNSIRREYALPLSPNSPASHCGHAAYPPGHPGDQAAERDEPRLRRRMTALTVSRMGLFCARLMRADPLWASDLRRDALASAPDGQICVWFSLSR